MDNSNKHPLGWTTLEEAKQLVEAGLPVKTADMYYWLAEGKEYVYTGKCSDSNGIPCWSLGALVQLLPRTIKQEYNLLINTELWVMYRNPFLKDVECLFDNSPFLIENVKDAIIWLLKNNYIK